MDNYTFLPFNFEKREDGRVFVVNFSGEYMFLSNNDFQSMVDGNLDREGELFQNLKSKQILTDTEIAPVVNMLATKYRTKKSFLNNYTTLHMVVPTLRCNGKCRYCQVSSKQLEDQSFDMSKETAKKTIDMVFCSPSPVIKIEFQGGEALLREDTLQFMVLYAKKLNKTAKKHLEFVVCTNLTLLTKKSLKFFKKHNIFISTSLDGNKDLHNRNRPLQGDPDSFSPLEKNIKITQEYLGRDKIAALMTTTRLSLDSMKDIIDEYIKNGFNYIFLRPLNPYGFAERDKLIYEYEIEEFIEAYKNALEYIIELNKKGTYFIESYTTLLLTRILTPFSTGFVDLQSPSGTGISCALYNYDGNVYLSDEGRMLASTGDKRFLMGNVRDEYNTVFNGKAIREVVENSCVECLPDCCDCAYQTYCGSDPIRNYTQTGELISPRSSSEFCKKNKILIEFLIDKYEKSDEETRDVFWSWITKRSIN